MERFQRLFRHSICNVIAMIHVKSLPGTPKSNLGIGLLSEAACREAEIYSNCSVDGIIVENMHDAPYTRGRVPPEITASMTRICSDVRSCVPAHIACGVQVLAAANSESIAVAQSSGFNFVRAEGFVFGHIADEGYIDGCAGPLLRYRRNIAADNIQVYCDLKKKHSSHAVTADVSIEETAKAAEFFLADGVIVTGSSTGSAAQVRDLEGVLASTNLPVMVGSGVTNDNVAEYRQAHALIVGSHFKRGGRWDQELDVGRVQSFMEMVDRLRQGTLSPS